MTRMLRMRHVMNAHETPNHLTSPQMYAFAMYFATGVAPWEKSWLSSLGRADKMKLGEFRERFESLFTGGKIREIRRACSAGPVSAIIRSESRKLAVAVGVFLSSDAFSKMMGFCLRSLQACTPAREMAKPPILPRKYITLDGFGTGKMEVRWLSHSMV